MEHAHIVDALLGLIETQNSVPTSLTDIKQFLVLAKGETRGGTKASQG